MKGKIKQFLKKVKENKKKNKKYDKEYFLKVEKILEEIKSKEIDVFLFKLLVDNKWHLVIRKNIEMREEFNNLGEVYEFLIDFLKRIKEDDNEN